MGQQRVLLNVGGESFVLNKPSAILGGDEGVLGTILDGTIPWDFDDETNDETIFFDRDPTFFQYILNYFHDASLPKDCLSPANMNSIRREAEYYSLKGLSTFMSDRIKEPFNERGKVAKHLEMHLEILGRSSQKSIMTCQISGEFPRWNKLR